MTEKYLYELPDYIAGKASPTMAQEIAKLIASNAEFRAEYETMKSTMQHVNELSKAIVADMEKSVPPFYFANFADNLERRLAEAPESPFQRAFAAMRPLFAPQQRLQLSGVFAVLLAALMLFSAVTRLDFHAISGDIAALKRAQPEMQDEKNTLSPASVATIQFASGFIPEVSLSAMSDEDEIAVLEKLKEELPTSEENKYNILSDDDVKSLLPAR